GIPPDRVRILAETPAPIRYDLPDALVGRVWGGKYRGQEQVWYLARFEGRDDEIDIATDHPEFAAWRWIDKAALLAAIVPFKRALYAEVLAAFDAWLA
ncbi:MAG: NUDIX domain-containing protein, partial [Rhodobacteraceae bacterium]|nr:NUDIX domain-containing protein [Paracoccaceae bacterium]